MRTRFRLSRRGCRGDKFYCVDTQTSKRTSLGTSNEDEAQQIIEAKNTAERQPVLNLQIAKAYLAGSDTGMRSRTWQDAVIALTAMKQGANRERWLRAAKDKAFAPLLPTIIIETHAELLLRVLQMGRVSTNVYLRRLHNFCLDMNWLPWPLVPKRQWPAVRFKDKRAITWDEHSRIIERENNPERRAFYQLAWHIGASQSDLAHLEASNVDWPNKIICFVRMKTRFRNQQPPQIRFGGEVERIFAGLPKFGLLFPYLKTVRSTDRANEFRQRCIGLGIKGVTLHSYRYAWAERAKVVG
jgi:integrase